MDKLETLKVNHTARIDEVAGYQLNIDNFIRAIDKIDQQYADNPAMQEFRSRLSALLEENRVEQLKAIIMRDVIADQIAELEAS